MGQKQEDRWARNRVFAIVFISIGKGAVVLDAESKCLSRAAGPHRMGMSGRLDERKLDEEATSMDGAWNSTLNVAQRRLRSIKQPKDG